MNSPNPAYYEALAAARGVRPAPARSWSILLTSANHGVVGPLGSTFPHAGEHHERVQVVELVEAGAPPAPDVDLASLLRFNMAGEPVAIEGATPVAAQAGQEAPAQPLAMVSPSELRDIQAGRSGVPVRGNQWRADQTVPIYAAPVAGQVAVPEADLFQIDCELESIPALMDKNYKGCVREAIRNIQALLAKSSPAKESK